MASLPSLYFPSSSSFILSPRHNLNFFLRPHPPTSTSRRRTRNRNSSIISRSFRSSYRFSVDHEDEAEKNSRKLSFDKAVSLFNQRAYYDCHDILEILWNRAQDPTRTLIHCILQCSVGLHHLFNRNHRGAMMELGEGLCKLRKMEFKSGPFYTFEREISAVLDFVYHTQIELAACDDNLCVTMDRSEKSYQLLGGYAAGQHLYDIEREVDGTACIVFCSQRSHTDPLRVKLPTLAATKEQLLALDYN